MDIEENIFRKYKLDKNKLISAGFIKKDDIYIYEKKIMNNNFKVYIQITKENQIIGKVYDLSFNEEYLNIRRENEQGQFVNTVRQNYINILKDIRDKCFTKNYFESKQANRITDFILEKYKNVPEFLWANNDKDVVFRNEINKKWYGIIMQINKSKLDEENRKVEILNVKLNEAKIQKLLTKQGFYKAYHMNKEKWISIILDDTVSDDEIISLIEESHHYTKRCSSFIIPANLKYFDIITYFKSENNILWKQPNNISLDDYVYIYIGKPYSCILYKCQVIEIDIPYNYCDQNISIKDAMRIKLIQEYNKNLYTLESLNKYGIKSIRGARKVNDEIFTKIEGEKNGIR